ncbi:MAG: hypothetical protein LBH15_00730, partial [Treponema sp.]|nr:hypothetical protein [Treponema sp.]
MKKPVAPRIAGLFLLYLAVFAFLVVLQFGSRRDFSFHAGAMTVSGHYGETSRGDDPAAGSGGILPEGDLGIFFGGVEFRITAPGGDFAFLRPGGEKERPEILSLGVEGDSAVIRFAGAGDDPLGLVFDSRSVSGRPELRIAGSFGEDYAGIEIPFRLLRNARIQDTSGGVFTVAAGGFSFSFGSSRLDMARRVLI